MKAEWAAAIRAIGARGPMGTQKLAFLVRRAEECDPAWRPPQNFTAAGAIRKVHTTPFRYHFELTALGRSEWRQMREDEHRARKADIDEATSR